MAFQVSEGWIAHFKPGKAQHSDRIMSYLIGRVIRRSFRSASSLQASGHGWLERVCLTGPICWTSCRENRAAYSADWEQKLEIEIQKSLASFAILLEGIGERNVIKECKQENEQKRAEGRWINMLFAIPIVQFPQNVLRQEKKGGWSRKAMENRFSLPKMQFTYKRGIHSLPGTFNANDDGRSFVICHLPYPAVPSVALECDCPPRSTRFVTNDPSTLQRGHPYRTWPKR